MPDPIWRILRHQGRGFRWLAGRTGTSLHMVKRFSCGQSPAPAEWRRRAAAAFDLPEDVCWLPRATVAAPELTETAA